MRLELELRLEGERGVGRVDIKVNVTPHVRTLVQERRWNIQRVLRSFGLPIPSQVVAVDPYHPLPPPRHISIRIGDYMAGREVNLEGAAKEDRT